VQKSIEDGSGEAQKIFIFWTRNAHFGAFSGQFEYSCLGCNTSNSRASQHEKGPERRSGRQKKDRNGVPVRSGPKRTLCMGCSSCRGRNFVSDPICTLKSKKPFKKPLKTFKKTLKPKNFF